jgi:putative hydrolase of the HAD superfamily
VTPARPAAVLLDVGGVFLRPEHDRIRGVIARTGSPHDDVDLDVAHYRSAARFVTDLDVEADWAAAWAEYLDEYVSVCGIPDDFRAEVHRHLDSEFADAALWCRVAPGCIEGIAALAATGVRLGIVSNADGLIAERLRERELVQVGPGLGVPVECVIDSGVVGVMKPDVRIFELALTAMAIDAGDVWYVGDMPAIDVVGARRAGITPVVMDPLALHADAGYDAIASLDELAARLAVG